MDASTLLKPYRLKPFCQWIILRGRPLNYLPWNFIHKTQGRKLPNPKENIKKNQVRSVRREQDRFIVTRAGIIYWSIDFSRWFTSINRIKSRVNPGSCQLFWDSPRLIGLLIGLDQKERIFLPKKTNKQNKTKTKQTNKKCCRTQNQTNEMLGVSPCQEEIQWFKDSMDGIRRGLERIAGSGSFLEHKWPHASNRGPDKYGDCRSGKSLHSWPQSSWRIWRGSTGSDLLFHPQRRFRMIFGWFSDEDGNERTASRLLRSAGRLVRSDWSVILNYVPQDGVNRNIRMIVACSGINHFERTVLAWIRGEKGVDDETYIPPLCMLSCACSSSIARSVDKWITSRWQLS